MTTLEMVLSDWTQWKGSHFKENTVKRGGGGVKFKMSITLFRVCLTILCSSRIGTPRTREHPPPPGSEVHHHFTRNSIENFVVIVKVLYIFYVSIYVFMCYLAEIKPE